MIGEQDPVRVVIAVETRIYREGISQLLSDGGEVELTSVTPDVNVIMGACHHAAAEVLLMDAMVPGAMDVVRDVKAELPSIRIIVLALAANRSQLSSFAEVGVNDFITQEDSIDDLKQCIHASSRGGFWCSKHLAAVLLGYGQSEPVSIQGNRGRTYPVNSGRETSDDVHVLTKQQMNVLELVEMGMSNKEIARQLFIETATVKNHVHQILQKLHVSTRGEAGAKLRRLSPA